MKKIYLVFAIGVFAACNSSATAIENAVDSAAGATVDSIQNKNDRLTTSLDSTSAVQADSVKDAVDTLKK